MKHIIILLLVVLLPLMAEAQSVREITISADKPYTDNFSLANESGDMDVMIKFSFNEADNQLTVSMTSYRGLFVFREDTRYKQVVKFGKLRIKELPYVVTGEEVPYKMPCKFKKQLGRHRKNFVFKRWLNYSGLLPEPMEYVMVNDVVEQKFGIVGDKRTSVSVTLGDVMIMEPKTNLFKESYYRFLRFVRVNTRYNITIERDPCFAMEEQISIASQQKVAATQALEGLRNTFPERVTNMQETFDLFSKTKEMLVKQYPKRDTVSDCPQLQALNDSFNVVVDSILAFKCMLVVSSDSTMSVANPSYLLSAAYAIDMKVSRWQLTTDALERADIIKFCNERIESVNDYVKRHGLRSKGMREAYDIMQKAVSYYQSTCHIRKQ